VNALIQHIARNNIITTRRMNQIRFWESLTDDALLAIYNEAFLKLFRHAIRNSPFYKKLYTLHYGILETDVKSIEDIDKLPVIDRQFVRHDIDKIETGRHLFRTRGLTSGTSGTPLQVYRYPTDICFEQAYVRYYRSMHGYQLGQPLLSIRGTLGKNETYRLNKASNILYISSPNINEKTIEQYHKMIRAFAPVAVEAYPSYLHKLAIELENKGLDLSIPNAFTSSETLLDYQRQKASAVLQTQIHDWYGNAERTVLLAQHQTGLFKPIPLYSIMEYGQDGIISTGLINHRFPLIRYRVDDRLSMENGSFQSNLIAPVIYSIDGRSSDVLSLKDGSVVGCVDQAFKGIANLNMAQVHQYSENEPILIKLVVMPSYTKEDEDQLRKNFIRMVGADTELQFIYTQPASLLISASGKYNLIIRKKPV